MQGFRDGTAKEEAENGSQTFSETSFPLFPYVEFLWMRLAPDAPCVEIQ
jgi:hypothetical protein